MRVVCALALLMSLSAIAQNPGNPQAGDQSWREELMNLPEHPAGNINIQQILRFERNLMLAAPYFAVMTPGDYEANRELIRRITVYNAAIEMLSRDPQISRDPQMRAAFGRSRRAFSQMRFGMPMSSYPLSAQQPQQEAQQVHAPAERRGPPFSMTAPALEKVPAADAKIANELCALYESDAARSAAAWQSAETLRVSLAAQGTSLNVQTATSVSRLQLYFESAAAALRERDWAEARTNLQRAEYETEKILKTVGR